MPFDPWIHNQKSVTITFQEEEDSAVSLIQARLQYWLISKFILLLGGISPRVNSPPRSKKHNT